MEKAEGSDLPSTGSLGIAETGQVHSAERGALETEDESGTLAFKGFVSHAANLLEGWLVEEEAAD